MGFENTIQEGNSCYKMCLAYMFDLHPTNVPFFCPVKNEGSVFWQKYENWVRHTLNKKTLWWYQSIESLLNSDITWVACVPSIVPSKVGKHAIVMKGSKIEYDPLTKAGLGRKRKPKKIMEGITFVD